MKLSCSRCGTRLKEVEPPPGVKVRCPRCQAPLGVPPSTTASPLPTFQAKPPSNRAGLFLAGGAAAGLMVLGVVVVAFSIAGLAHKEEHAALSNTAGPPPAAPPPTVVKHGIREPRHGHSAESSPVRDAVELIPAPHPEPEAPHPEPEAPPPPVTAARPEPPPVAAAPAKPKDEPRPLDPAEVKLRQQVARAAESALKFIVRQQSANGGWVEGVEKDAIGKKPSNNPTVAHTALNGLALLRAGNGDDLGPYAKNVVRAVDFVCGQVEKADKTTLRVPTVEGTQIQSKLGPFVDSCLALRFLAEVRGRMPDEAGEKRVTEALAKLVAKFEANQRPDGSWALWPHAAASSPVDLAFITQALCQAKEGGLAVNEVALRNAQNHTLERLSAGPTAREALDGRKITLITATTVGSDNVVDVSGMAGFLGTLQTTIRTNRERQLRLRATIDNPNGPDGERRAAAAEWEKMAEAEKGYEQTVETVLKNLSNPGLVSYLNKMDNYGGDEYLSYVLITEALSARGGKDWDAWRDRVTRRVLRQQHADGSWSASHGISGGNFCTPAALLVLQADPAFRKEIAEKAAAPGDKDKSD
jgi:Prenyltransferase and squalene oxidase repeat